MAQATIIQNSFSSGELAPNLFGRTDMKQYANGVARMRNFFVDFRGGTSNRPGTRYIATCVTGTRERVIPFVVSTTSSYVLEFYNLGVKVWQSGVLVTTLTTPYIAADLPLLKYVQSADVMTLTHPTYPPAYLTLVPPNTWTYAAINVGPKVASPGTLTATPPSTTYPDYCYSYVVTAVSPNGVNESLPCAPVLAHYTVLDETRGFVIPLKWVPSTSPVSVYRIYKCGPFDDRDSTGAGSAWGYIGSSQTDAFTDINIAPDFSREPPQYGDPFSPGQFKTIGVNSGGGGYPSGGSWTGYIPLVITDSTGTGAAGFAVTSYQGIVTGVFLTNSGKNYTAPTITAGAGGATFTYTLTSVGTASPPYPGTPSYIQQRAVFGGATNSPITITLSQTGDYTNFNIAPGTIDANAFSLDLNSLQANAIKSFIPVSYGMLAFTSGGSFLISGGSPGSSITPASVTSQVQAAEGANDVPPIAINFSVLYIQNKGNIVRDLSFAWQRQSFVGPDISALSNHLFINYQILEWCWQQEPFKLVWAVRDDGRLLSLTYVPDQEIWGWAEHDTQGLFQSICAVPEGDTYAVYTIVQRIVGGVTVQYLERFADRRGCCILDGWFVDAALSTTSGFPVGASPPTGTMYISGTAPNYTITFK